MDRETVVLTLTRYGLQIEVRVDKEEGDWEVDRLAELTTKMLRHACPGGVGLSKALSAIVVELAGSGFLETAFTGVDDVRDQEAKFYGAAADLMSAWNSRQTIMDGQP